MGVAVSTPFPGTGHEVERAWRDEGVWPCEGGTGGDTEAYGAVGGRKGTGGTSRGALGGVASCPGDRDRVEASWRTGVCNGQDRWWAIIKVEIGHSNVHMQR